MSDYTEKGKMTIHLKLVPPGAPAIELLAEDIPVEPEEVTSVIIAAVQRFEDSIRLRSLQDDLKRAGDNPLVIEP